MKRRTMTKEGGVGIVLILAVILVTVVFLMPRGFERALGHGFATADLTRVTVTQDSRSLALAPGDEGYADLITVLDGPSYSRTSTKDESAPVLSVVCETAEDAWTLTFGSGKLTQVQHGADRAQNYQLSTGSETVQALARLLGAQEGGDE